MQSASVVRQPVIYKTRTLNLTRRLPVEKMLRAFQVPELLQYGTRSTITRWLKSGALEGKKVGGRWFVTSRAVEAFLKGDSAAISKR